MSMLPRGMLGGLSVLNDRESFSVTGAGDAPSSSVFLLGLCPGYPGFVEETHPDALDESWTLTRAKM